MWESFGEDALLKWGNGWSWRREKM
jgi:hypothetical protein